MGPHEPGTESETEFELPFGWSVRIWEAGFFAVLFAVSVAFIVLAGVGLLSGESAGLVRVLLSTLLGSIGVLVSVAGGRNALQLLLDRRPALTISEEGILNRTYWSATTLVRWDEVIDIRRSPIFFISEIVLRDPDAFRRRQTPWVRTMMRITSLLGVGSLPVYLPQVAAPNDEISRRLSAGLEASELAAMREHRQLEAAAGEEPAQDTAENGGP